MNKVRRHYTMVSLALILVNIYFICHCFIGERGYIKILKLRNELAVSKAEISIVVREKKYLENKVKLMNDQSIDKDLLDEISRSYFGLIGKGEVCAYTPSFWEGNSE